jgi:hypothetical protein
MELEKKEEKSLAPHQENFVEVENHCCLCGTPLEFEHSFDEAAIKVKEKAHCPCCKIQLKEKEHSIH